jgi:IS30 family transposase
VRKPRLRSGSELFGFICEKLEATWSPEEIALKWKRLHPEEKLSPCTIYRAVRKDLLPGIAARTHLRRRGKQKYAHRSKFNTIQPERTIHDRPEVVERRERIGDWEGDTLCGGKGKGSLITCVDRKSRYLAVALLSNNRAKQVTQAMCSALKDLPVHSLTLDNGAEFADFHNIEAQLNAPVYFADPRSPWQRGTNENTNGRLRFFFPRGSDFRSITQERLNQVVDRINSRPRKCLGGLSPKDVFFAVCCT